MSVGKQLPAAAPAAGDAVARSVVVSPGMCGGSRLFAQIGDWTWDAVAAACRTDVHGARTANGDPAYLSFYYFRVRGGRALHPHGLAFGDRLDVSSRVFDFGSRATFTLHRLAPAGLGLGGAPLDPVEACERPHPDCIYAETFNRWVSRASAGSNRGLTERPPPDFVHEHLPRLPNAYSPRTLLGRARQAGTFWPGGPPGCVPAGPELVVRYALDVARDLNGAGLLYFATYFSIFDEVLLGLWRAAGRGDAEFLRRRVRDQRIGYFGNADLGAVFTLTGRRWRRSGDPGTELVDLAMREAGTGRLVAVAGVELALEVVTVAGADRRAPG